jgi:hypothetical protein
MLYSLAAGLVMPAFLLLMLLVAVYVLQLHLFLERLRQFESGLWNELGQPELLTYTPLTSLRIARLLRRGEAIQDQRAAKAGRVLGLLHRLLAGTALALVLLELAVNLGRH